MRLFKNRILIILVLSLIFSSYTANIALAYNDINFRNLTIEDGLTQGTIETMYQDSKGYIWIGTNDGLNRYNGYDFKKYVYEEGNPNSIANSYIVDIKEDKDNNIWVGTSNGLSKIDTKTDTIKNYFQYKSAGNLSDNNIGETIVTKTGDIIVGTSFGLNKYNKKEDKFERIFAQKDGLKSQCIYSLVEDGDGNIWVATDAGLSKINIKENKITTEYYDNKGENNSNVIYNVTYDRFGYIWAGTKSAGVVKINIKTNESKRYKNDSKNPKSLPGNYVKDSFRDSEGNLWVATNNGLAKYDEGHDNFLPYKNKVYDKHTLVSDDVYKIMEDKSGLIWVGTQSGISIFDPKNKIEYYRNDPFNSNTLSESTVFGIYEDEDGFLWVGSSTKGITVLDRKNDVVKHVMQNGSEEGLSDNRINDIQGKKDRIYVATENGLDVLDKKGNIVKRYTEKDGLLNNDVRTLFIDSKNNVWVGSTKGVNILNSSDNTIEDITPYLKYTTLDVLNGAIYEDKEGNYWIGSMAEGGLKKFNLETKEVKTYKYIEGNKNSISGNSIKAINEDGQGNIWIGTTNGLNKLDPKTERFTRYTTKNGLSNNTIYGILIDAYDNPWCSTNLGISKLDVKNNRFLNLTITDGLQGSEFNGKSSFKNSKGEFFFGGVNGLNIFNPHNINKHNYDREVVFDEFSVKGKTYKNINNMNFAYDENMINISVFLPDYINTKNTNYYYKLEGSSNKSEWNLMENNEINYSNLAPGKYTFKIKARNYNGIMSKESTVNFTIEPPFWRSNAAIVLYALIVILIIYIIRANMRRLDILVAKRTNQLSIEMEKSNSLLNKVIELERNKNNYFINLSHELRTPLNVIHTTEQLITELNKSEKGIPREKLGYYMTVLKNNTSRLLKLINNLIDSTKIEHGSYRINLEEKDIVYIVEETTLGLKDYIESKGIDLIIDPEIEEKIIECDETEIQRCIVNLVGNASKFTPEGGTIEVKVEDLEDKVKISVEDSGIGIDPKHQDLIFNRFNQVVDSNSEVKGGSGLGLTITKHIIELHKGEIYVESELNKGSKFIIILPTKVN